METLQLYMAETEAIVRKANMMDLQIENLIEEVASVEKSKTVLKKAYLTSIEYPSVLEIMKKRLYYMSKPYYKDHLMDKSFFSRFSYHDRQRIINASSIRRLYSSNHTMIHGWHYLMIADGNINILIEGGIIKKMTDVMDEDRSLERYLRYQFDGKFKEDVFIKDQKAKKIQKAVRIWVGKTKYANGKKGLVFRHAEERFYGTLDKLEKK